VNAHEIDKKPFKHYLQSFSKVHEYIRKDLVDEIEHMSDGHLKFQMFESMARKGSVLLKQVNTRIDGFFSHATIDDSDKLAYQTAYSRIKQGVEQNLRSFKAFIDLEENQKVG
jgi:hypothetical protein